jgi:asparagine synthase (glutamine-hydrolysing)
VCGIGAILRADGGEIPEAWLDTIDDRISHRGPDGHGRFRDRVELDGPDGHRVVEVALTHRRLSILDHEGGAQPMVSKRGRTREEGLVAVVFNGCIYNHRRLRFELQERGHRFASDHSDTEVLLHGHREWGDGLQERIEGMYAYALWDRDAASLTLARDWFGEKPLYHRLEHNDDGVRMLVAASDAAAVAAIPGAEPIDTATRLAWTTNYLRFGHAVRGRTIATAGTATTLVENVEPSLPRELVDASPGDVDVTADEIERLLDKAVARRLEADVPLGCFLSGGVDSSLIACLALRHVRQLQTFSVRMPDPRYDESGHAADVAAHLGTNHRTLEIAMNPAEDLVKLIETLGQPFGDSSLLPTSWVSRAARQHVKVALSGDGGDELFVGYERYLAAGPLARQHGLLKLLPAGLLQRAHPRSLLHKMGRLGAMARDFPELGVLATEAIFTEPMIAELLGEPPPRPQPDKTTDDSPLAALRRADLTGYLPDDLLCKVDTASMAVALEVRCPYLDRDLVRRALSAPLGALIPGRRRKALLRSIARKHLPASVVDRPKMGFAVPIGQWFRADFGGLRGLLLDQLHAVEPFGPIPLQRKPVRRMLDEHMAGTFDHGQRLFALLTLSIWASRR